MPDEKTGSSATGGVLFDVDGTLLDTYEALERCFHIAYTTVFGHDGSFDAFKRTIGRPLSDQLWLYTDDADVHQRLLEAYRHANRSLDNEGMPFPGIVDAIKDLRCQGFPVGVVTSKFSKAAHRVLGKAGVASLLDCIVGADETAHAKPSPEPILLGARRLGIDPCDCVYIGDSPYDMQAGHGAGAKTIAVAWGQHPLESLRAESPDAIATVPEDIPGIVDELCSGNDQEKSL